MSEAQVIFSCAAYDVVEGQSERHRGSVAVVELKAGDELACNEFRSGLYHHFQIGSVVSSCMARGACPISGVERAQSNGHDLWFIFGLGSMITSQPQARKTYIGVELNQVVKFEGRYFKILPRSNDNLGLVEVEAPAIV